jgi:hypothetical protein
MPATRLRWTPGELDRALAAAPGGIEAVEAACPARGRAAILNFVNDLHRLHQGRRPRHLARYARQHVVLRRGQFQCPRCGQAI